MSHKIRTRGDQQCPSCGGWLGPWERGNAYENAGRECGECMEFFVCGPQPEYAEPYGGAVMYPSESIVSDADPGL